MTPTPLDPPPSLATIADVTAEAKAVAAGLVGLDAASAQATVDRHANLELRIPIGDAIGADSALGRITAWAKDGIVVDAYAG